jgi:hypothetical protein
MLRKDKASARSARSGRKVRSDAGASAGDETAKQGGTVRAEPARGKPGGAERTRQRHRAPSALTDAREDRPSRAERARRSAHALVRVGSAAMPAPFALATPSTRPLSFRSLHPLLPPTTPASTVSRRRCLSAPRGVRLGHRAAARAFARPRLRLAAALSALAQTLTYISSPHRSLVSRRIAPPAG